jgi:16S rRNA (cytidine1402-2'-O)-methyltransferase
MKKGRLFLIPVTLGNNDTINKVLPEYNNLTIHKIKIFIVEQIRTARRFLRAVNHPVAIDDITFLELNKHTDIQAVSGYLNYAAKGEDIGLLSEAGTPCIADPGAIIVEKAHEKGIKIKPLVGPNSIIIALMASGFNGQHFLFHGYLPIENSQRNKKIKELEINIYKNNQTQIFIETPYRNNKMLDTLLNILKPETKICIAADITLKTEFIKTLPVKLWKKEKVNLHKRPVVFLIYK